MTAPLRGALALVVVTDGQGDAARVQRIVSDAVAGGARCVQVREPQWTAREYAACCERLLPVLDAVGGSLLVNDRLDVAAAGLAHGAWLGHRSLPIARARRALPHGVLAYSAHDAGELEAARAAGCDFASLSPVFATTSKPGAPALGVTRAAELTLAAGLPVVWLGGIGIAEAAQARGIAAGVAVRAAVMGAASPRAAATALLAAVATAP